MRKIIVAAFVIVVFCLISNAQTGALPTLRGGEAINELKGKGQYNSLMDAVKAARKENGQTDEPQTEDAIGQMTRLNGSDSAANDQFGLSVSISGDTAIVGAYLDDVGANTNQGSAYVFIKSGTVWTQQQKLTASDGAGFDQFGWSVSISGETAIIGANTDDVVANTDQGSAYVFVRSGVTWTQQQQLTASDGLGSDNFGYSVSISGETAIIGANFDDTGVTSNHGSAYVFVRSGVTWTEQQKLIASDGAGSDQFGLSVSISGETVIIGAPLDDVIANSDQGSAYVFIRSGVTWTQQQKLTASDGAAFDQLGFSIALNGETAIIGANGDDTGANTDQGAAYVFVRSGVTWTEQQKLIALDGANGDQFGYSVSISGDTAIVGAALDDAVANSNQGSAYVFIRSGVTWTQQQQLTASDGASADQFGQSVAISGNNIIVGAVVDDVGANSNQGSAYAFRVLASGWTQEAQKVAADGLGSDFFGWSVAISGDTAIVGAPLDDVSGNGNRGSAYIFVRNGTAWTQQQQLTASDGATSDSFGFSVGIYGDTVIVGAYLNAIGANTTQGSAYVFTRSGGVWTEQQQLTASDGLSGDRFGYSVAISNNTAIVGAYLDDVGANPSQGSAYVFTRSGVTWTQQQQLTASDGGTGDQLGQSVSIFGNTAVVGASFADVGANADQGEVYVYVRSGVTWTEQQILMASDAAAGDSFGYSVSISGETLIIGALADDVVSNVNQGSAYVFTRSGVTWTQQAQLFATGGAASDQFGQSVSLDGDTAVIGANLDDVGANGNQGSAYVFFRASTVWTQQQQLFATGGAANDSFGFNVGISGDKIIVGAPNSDVSTNIPLAPQATDQGAVFIFINNLIPLAANVSVSGRILAANGNGVRNAIVQMTTANGEVVQTRSSSFGYYRFDDIEASQTVIVQVQSKRFQFAPQVISLNENIADLDFMALP